MLRSMQLCGDTLSERQVASGKFFLALPLSMFSVELPRYPAIARTWGWRARQDSNLWPSAPEADALSS